MKKAMPILIALVLIVGIAGFAIGKYFIDKYAYGTEEADLKEYFGLEEDGRLAILLQDEILAETALPKNETIYFAYTTVQDYIDEAFYVDTDKNELLYTTATEIIRTQIGQSIYQTESEVKDLQHPTCFYEEDALYVAADYVALFADYSYEVYDLYVQVRTEWGSRNYADVSEDTQLRLLGGIKSPILCQLEVEDTVVILEKMNTWSRVKSGNSLIGYVENEYLVNERTEQETPVKNKNVPEYTSMSFDGKVCLGWHSIGGPAGNDTLYAMVAEAKGMNVIAPTWFSMNDSEGGFRSFASAGYVEKAHQYGLQVWGVLDNFNYANETKTSIDVQKVLSTAEYRKKLTEGVVGKAVELGLDGINIDFEQLSASCGIHYVQFLRELSILCRKEQLVLSIDNYVPFQFNEYYRLDIQGEIADYVIIMGYDEHWHGCGEAGSVASIDYVTNGIEKTVAQVPSNKVVNALPFYTILWATEGTKVTDEYLTLNNTADFLKRIGRQPVWDDKTCQNYLEWTSGNRTYSIWLEDGQSINAKLNVMNAHNLGGVAVWRLGYGTEAVWELLRAYVNS